MKKRENDNFTKLYITYYPKLLRFAVQYILSEEDARNLVQDVFMGLWERRDYLDLISNPNAYLFRLTKNQCLNYLQHKLYIESHRKEAQNSFEIELSLKLQSLSSLDDSLFSEEQMNMIIQQAILQLPEKCRQIFNLSRIEGLKYKEIAEHLNISVNTVENQMSIALKKLRILLKDYLGFLLFI